MVDFLDRRVTRSKSNELQRAREAAAQQSVSFQGLRNTTPELLSSYNAHSQQQQQNYQQCHNPSSVGRGHLQLPRSSSMEHHLNQQQQQEQLQVGMNGGGSLAESPTCPHNTSEEIFLNSLINSTLVPGTPSIEAASLGFLDTLQPQLGSPQNLRGNSEELFRNWIATNLEKPTQNENGANCDPSSTGNQPLQKLQRMSSELQAIIPQQNRGPEAPRADSVEQNYLHTNSYPSQDIISHVNNAQLPDRRPPSNPVYGPRTRSNPSNGKPASNDYSPLSPLKYMLFDAPMTRSRSSELRRKNAQEGLRFPTSAEPLPKLAPNGALKGSEIPGMTTLGSLAQGIGNTGSLQNDSESKAVGLQVPPGLPLSCAPVDHKQHIQPAVQPVEQHGHIVSDAVGLLKSSLERKKLHTKQQQLQAAKQVRPQQLEVRSRQTPISPLQGKAPQDESLNRQQFPCESRLIQLGQVQQNNLGHGQSLSGSSHSAGMATSDGPSNSGMSAQRQALKRSNGAVDQLSPNCHPFSVIDSPSPHSNGDIHENGVTKTDTLKRSQQLVRAGSITSSLRPGFHVNELDGATKKRRVERHRKMAEAKGRGNAPPMPADLQAAMKRCDALEKEVRSSKLNISFMNRKDSEQTKKIEELEQQNKVLKKENKDWKKEIDRLLEELERVSAVHDPE